MLKRIGLTLGGAALAVLAWGSLVERNRFTLREQSLRVLPTGHRPVRILQLSDLHMTPWQRRKQDWVAGLATLQPDLVIGTGDFLGHERGIVGVARALAPFEGVPGVFVNGSNDYFAPKPKNPLKYFLGPSKTPPRPRRLDTEELRELYRALGWVDLNNRVTELSVAGNTLELFGVDDAHKDYDRTAEVAALLDEQRAASSVVDARIGVTHAPYIRVLDSFTAQGADLICAGHTHGGQVCLPEVLGGTLVTNCDIPRSQAKGFSRWSVGAQSAALNVSAGIGTSMYAPIRLFCPPEATLITLLPRD